MSVSEPESNKTKKARRQSEARFVAEHPEVFRNVPKTWLNQVAHAYRSIAATWPEQVENHGGKCLAVQGVLDSGQWAREPRAARFHDADWGETLIAMIWDCEQRNKARRRFETLDPSKEVFFILYRWENRTQVSLAMKLPLVKIAPDDPAVFGELAVRWSPTPREPETEFPRFEFGHYCSLRILRESGQPRPCIPAPSDSQWALVRMHRAEIKEKHESLGIRGVSFIERPLSGPSVASFVPLDQLGEQALVKEGFTEEQARTIRYGVETFDSEHYIALLVIEHNHEGFDFTFFATSNFIAPPPDPEYYKKHMDLGNEDGDLVEEDRRAALGSKR